MLFALPTTDANVDEPRIRLPSRFGNPDGNDWEVKKDMLVVATRSAEMARKWRANPDELEFLLFGRRCTR